MEPFDDELCAVLLHAERLAHDALNRAISDRRSARRMIRDRKVEGGKTVVEIRYANKFDGTHPIGAFGMRRV